MPEAGRRLLRHFKKRGNAWALRPIAANSIKIWCDGCREDAVDLTTPGCAFDN
jgi:hypothetical protein